MHVSVQVAGACTNGNADALLVPTLASSFTFALSAVEAGVAKPDPRIFEQAWALARTATGAAPAAGTEPQAEWVHVGDNLAEDCGGARAAGARSIWFNPQWVSTHTVNYHQTMS